MAVILYKAGNSHVIRGVQCTIGKFSDIHSIESMEKAGWYRNPEDIPVNEPESEEDETIRELAKEAGIGNYWNKNIEKLKDELQLNHVKQPETEEQDLENAEQPEDGSDQ